jgi:hypothetical protein
MEPFYFEQNIYIFYTINRKDMKRPSRQDDGFYHINGHKFKMLFGSRQQVWNKTAYKTAGELCHNDLMMNKWGRIVSKKKHATAKREKRLQKHGFFAKKGSFGVVKRSVRSRTAKKHSKTARKGGEPPVPQTPTTV